MDLAAFFGWGGIFCLGCVPANQRQKLDADHFDGQEKENFLSSNFPLALFLRIQKPTANAGLAFGKAGLGRIFAFFVGSNELFLNFFRFF